MTSFLKIANIETHYSGRICALHRFSLDIREGEIFAILGPKGAGKTTLLKTIAGLLKDQPKKGSILFDGRPIQRLAPEKISALRIVCVPEDRDLFWELTVGENLELGCWGRSDYGIQADMDAVLELFPVLKERRNLQAESLSIGEQQILAIAMAFLGRPMLLMLDEPSRGLEPPIADGIFDALVKINRLGTTILLAEQSAMPALRIAHRGCILEAGRIVLKGTARELMEHPAVQEFYPGLSWQPGSQSGDR